MTIAKDVLSEVLSMFVSDARLTGAILGSVLIAAVLISATSLPPLVGGIFLVLACVVVLVQSVRRAARATLAAKAQPPR